MGSATDLTYEAADALARNMPWMVWNLTLAFVPLVLAAVLFRGRRGGRSPVWWLGAAAFVAFLPNAAYVLTDVIHLVADARRIPSVAVVSLAIVPQYALFFALGFEAYVLSVIAVGRYIARSGHTRWVVPAEIALHGLAAVGIYLGRFLRLNSWDLVTQPDSVTASWSELTGPPAIAAMVVTFAIVSVLYWALKQITLAVIAVRRQPTSTPFAR